MMPLELSDRAVGVEVDPSGTEGNATPFVDEDVSVAALFVVDMLGAAPLLMLRKRMGERAGCRSRRWWSRP